MAGTVDLIQRGYTGIETRGHVLWFNPCLPEELEHLRMQIRYRGHSLSVEINSDNIKVSAFRCSEEPIRIGVKDEVFDLREGDSKEVALEGSALTRPGRSGSH